MRWWMEGIIHWSMGENQLSGVKIQWWSLDFRSVDVLIQAVIIRRTWFWGFFFFLKLSTVTAPVRVTSKKATVTNDHIIIKLIYL